MIPVRPHPQARYFVPEVVQTSVMDCGPASLQALVAGFGLSVNYGRLREACQTGVDGTSITMMDEIGNFLGLDTEEMMLPADHLFVTEARALPAIVVVRNPDGTNHFVVAWSVAGPWVQVMDPSEGRHWTLRSMLVDKLYIHTARVPASAWRSWVAEPEFLEALDVRLAALGIAKADRARLRAGALADPGWETMAALDCATRMTTAMVRSGAVPRGATCLTLIEGQVERDADGKFSMILGEYRSAWRALDQDPDDEEETLEVRGAVIVRVRGLRGAGQAARTRDSDGAPVSSPVPPELAATLNEKPVQPGRALFRMLVADGIATPAVLALVIACSAALVTTNALLLRGFLELGTQLGLASQRAAAMLGLVGFLCLGLILEIPLIAGALRLGRSLDLRLRLAFLAKLPRLDDRYFRSRLLSDMAERGHSLHIVRALPSIGVRLLASSTQLVLTVAGIAWLQPASAPMAMISAAACIALPVLLQPLMAERELRVRAHAGALGRFYLDALIGLLPIRVHGARPAMQRQQETLLVQWVRAGLRFHAASTLVEGALALGGLAMAVMMVLSVSDHSAAGLLLLVYWALNLPALGQDIAIVARQYPALRNVVSRLLEPLSTPEPESSPTTAPHAAAHPVSPRAARIQMTGVTVEAGGNTVLDGVDLAIAPGEHVAVVGVSGAGKSSLVGLLLGWYRAAEGTVVIDGHELVGDRLHQLRRETAWVDPSVTLWNRSFLENLRYGAADDGQLPLAEILSHARLREVLEHLPDGLATELGEGGGMISGGEGQRTRVGRALARKQARLVILDEPFRGLDLRTRRELLAMARDWWRDATILWVTHDIAETDSFGRVLVLDGGRIVEDGAPSELAANPESRYATLAAGDREMHATEWAGDRWRRVWMDEGKLREEGTGS